VCRLNCRPKSSVPMVVLPVVRRLGRPLADPSRYIAIVRATVGEFKRNPRLTGDS
jgi:hypothetical protein